MPMTLGDFIREARAQIREWDPETAHHALQRQGVLVVDVREPGEFAKGHLAGAICVPRGILEAAADPGCKYRDERLCHAQGEQILLYCQSGGRSAMAAVTLQRMGYGCAYNLAGGIECWQADGFPVVA